MGHGVAVRLRSPNPCRASGSTRMARSAFFASDASSRDRPHRSPTGAPRAVMEWQYRGPSPHLFHRPRTHCAVGYRDQEEVPGAGAVAGAPVPRARRREASLAVGGGSLVGGAAHGRHSLGAFSSLPGKRTQPLRRSPGVPGIDLVLRVDLRVCGIRFANFPGARPDAQPLER